MMTFARFRLAFALLLLLVAAMAGRFAPGRAWGQVPGDTAPEDADKQPAAITDGPPGVSAPNPALSPNRAYTFYLSGDRIWRRCYWRMIPPDAIELRNATGVSACYAAREILGVDRHPVWRRLVGKGIRGTGLAGRAIVPQAFDDEAHLDYP